MSPPTLLAPAHKNLFASETYAEFKSDLAASGCSLCSELCQGRTSIVVDRGNSKTKLILIGEAPGEKEDLQGQSFVGRSGKLLDEMMGEIGIETNRDALILNVVKCRPPNNRAPKPEEASLCRPYLEWQLNFVKPKVIVLLGATAAKYFIPDQCKGGLKKSVGRFFEHPDHPGAKFFLLYHPAYILRDPRKKPEMRKHIKILKEYLEVPS